MFGSVTGDLLEVVAVSIHGDVYFDVVAMVHRSAGAAPMPLKVRLPHHLCIREPQVGDRVRLEFLMQQPTSVVFES